MADDKGRPILDLETTPAWSDGSISRKRLFGRTLSETKLTGDGTTGVSKKRGLFSKESTTFRREIDPKTEVLPQTLSAEKKKKSNLFESREVDHAKKQVTKRSKLTKNNHTYKLAEDGTKETLERRKFLYKEALDENTGIKTVKNGLSTRRYVKDEHGKWGELSRNMLGFSKDIVRHDNGDVTKTVKRFGGLYKRTREWEKTEDTPTGPKGNTKVTIRSFGREDSQIAADTYQPQAKIVEANSEGKARKILRLGASKLGETLTKAGQTMEDYGKPSDRPSARLNALRQAGEVTGLKAEPPHTRVGLASTSRRGVEGFRPDLLSAGGTIGNRPLPTASQVRVQPERPLHRTPSSSPPPSIHSPKPRRVRSIESLESQASALDKPPPRLPGAREGNTDSPTLGWPAPNLTAPQGPSRHQPLHRTPLSSAVSPLHSPQPSRAGSVSSLGSAWFRNEQRYREAPRSAIAPAGGRDRKPLEISDRSPLSALEYQTRTMEAQLRGTPSADSTGTVRGSSAKQQPTSVSAPELSRPTVPERGDRAFTGRNDRGGGYSR